MTVRTRFALIGDPHLAVAQGDPDPLLEIDPGRKLHGESKALLEAVVRAVNAENGLEAAIVLGDMTRDGELFNHTVAAVVLSQLDCPYYVVAGNHDLIRQRRPGVTYPDDQRLDLDGFRQFYEDRGLPEGQLDYTVELGGAVDLHVLNSNFTLEQLAEAGIPVERQDDGFVTDAQRGWLAERLDSGRGAGRLPLVVLHHTVMEQSPVEAERHMLYNTFRFWQLHGAAEMRALLAQYRVPLVLSGHLHAQSINQRDGVTNLVTAATVSYPHSYRVITVTEDAIICETRSPAEHLSGGFIERSRAQLSEGMGSLIRGYAAGNAMTAPHADAIAAMVQDSGWWPAFCDGTAAGFKVAPELQQGDMLRRMVLGQVAGILNEYGTWKAQRPDPNYIELPLADYS
jgi:predicted phosphodiesterase